ncbi:unnamed protein product [Urochloa humidicola]
MQVQSSETAVITLPASAYYPSHISKDNSEYISIGSSASLRGVALLHFSTKVPYGSVVLFASMLDKGPWPPPLKYKNTLLSDTVKSYFSLGLSFYYGQDVVKQRPPWPPPLICCQNFPTDTAQPCLRSWQFFIWGLADGQLRQPWPPPIYFDTQKTDVKLRPIPWPSFGSWNAHCASGQHSKKDMDFVLWIFGKFPWLFAVLVCWSSYTIAAMVGITSAILSQFYSGRFELVQSGICVDKVQLGSIPWLFFWNYSVDVHCLNLLSTVYADLATDVQTSVLCQLNVQFKALWLLPDWTWSSACEANATFIQRSGVELWPIHIEMFQLLPFFTCITSDTSTTNTMHLQTSVSWLSQDAILAEFRCYQLQGKGVRTEHIIPQNIQPKFCHLPYNNFKMLQIVAPVVCSSCAVVPMATNDISKLDPSTGAMLWLTYIAKIPRLVHLLLATEVPGHIVTLLPQSPSNNCLDLWCVHSDGGISFTKLLVALIHYYRLLNYDCWRYQWEFAIAKSTYQRDVMQCLPFLVQQLLTALFFTSIIVNQQNIHWDPGDDSCFLDGCTSPYFLIDLDVMQVVLHLIKPENGMPGCGSDAIHSSIVLAWSTTHLIGVIVTKSDEVTYGSQDLFSGVSNIIFMLHFYSLMIDDP